MSKWKQAERQFHDGPVGGNAIGDDAFLFYAEQNGERRTVECSRYNAERLLVVMVTLLHMKPEDILKVKP